MTEIQEIVYRVIFTHLDQIYTLFSQGVSEETLVGFIEVDGILSVQRERNLSSDESKDNAERLYDKFDGVKRTYIPMHSIVRIDELPHTLYKKNQLKNDQEPANIRHIHGGKFAFADEDKDD